MEITTTGQTLVHLGISLAYAIVTLVVAVATLWGIDRFLYPQIDFIEEIKKGNTAAAIFYSVILIFVAILVSTAIN
jgi:uncharacterized membrane protein YjfL (UPF0719 family)